MGSRTWVPEMIMNKEEFLKTLERLLKGLPKQENQKMLDYYAEMIEDRMEEGMSEENAVQDWAMWE